MSRHAFANTGEWDAQLDEDTVAATRERTAPALAQHFSERFNGFYNLMLLLETVRVAPPIASGSIRARAALWVDARHCAKAAEIHKPAHEHARKHHANDRRSRDERHVGGTRGARIAAIG
jgi:hypothetical protein